MLEQSNACLTWSVMHPDPVYLSLIGWKLNKKRPLINCIDGFIYFLLPNRFMLFLLNLKKVQKVASPVRIFDKTKTPSSNPMPSCSIFFKQFNNGRSLSYLSVLKILVYKCVFGLIQKLKMLLVGSQMRSKLNIGGAPYRQNFYAGFKLTLLGRLVWRCLLRLVSVRFISSF